jgi:hypothetical protein
MAAHYGRVFYHDKTLWISPTHNQGFKPTPMEMIDPSIQLFCVTQDKKGTYRANLDDCVFIKVKSREAENLEDIGSYDGVDEVIKITFTSPDPRQIHPPSDPPEGFFYWKTLMGMEEKNRFRLLRFDLVHDVSWTYGKEGVFDTVTLRAVNDDYTVKIDDRVNTHEKWVTFINKWVKEHSSGV